MTVGVEMAGNPVAAQSVSRGLLDGDIRMVLMRLAAIGRATRGTLMTNRV
jgi:hypothetical protein